MSYDDNLKIEQLFNLLNGILYTRKIPKEAEELAIKNGFIVVLGGGDDLMYAYGADSYLTRECEHSYGWDGCDLTKDIDDKELMREAQQLGLKIFWCGHIEGTCEWIKDYNTDESGAFSYKVKEGILSKPFIVYENEEKYGVYCTGLIIKLPDGFVRGSK